MKIAVLVNAYLPVRSGAIRIAQLQVEMLEKAGHDVRVWHPEILWFGLPAWQRVWHHLEDLKPHSDLVSEICAWQPDLLITHNLTGCGFGTPKEIQKQGIRWVHVLHDVQLFEPSGQLKQNFFRVWWNPAPTPWQMFWADWRRPALGSPDAVISPTQWLLKEHERQGFFRSKVRKEVLPNPGPVIERMARTIHQPIKLLFVGQVTREKGSRVLEEIARTVSVPYELHVVGDGPELARLKEQVPQGTYHGWMEPEQIRALMKESDFLLVPSLIEENQPTVILEAAAVGLPVVAMMRGGIPETLLLPVIPSESASRGIPSKRSLRSSSDSSVGMTEEVELIAGSLDQYQKAVEKMYTIAEHHEPEAYAQRFVSLIESLSKR